MVENRFWFECYLVFISVTAVLYYFLFQRLIYCFVLVQCFVRVFQLYIDSFCKTNGSGYIHWPNDRLNDYIYLLSDIWRTV